MKCTECEQYHVLSDCDGDPDVICDDGGDTSNPDEDIMCQSAGDKEEDYETISVTQKARDILALKRKNEEETKNRICYTLFDPVAVGWGIGLQKSIENAQMMHVPLGVKTQKHLDSVKGLFPNVNIIIVDGESLCN